MHLPRFDFRISIFGRYSPASQAVSSLRFSAYSALGLLSEKRRRLPLFFNALSHIS